MRGCHKARFALQEGMFRGRPKVDGNRALSVRAKPPREGPSWVGLETGVSWPEALVVVMRGASCWSSVPLLCSLRREVREVRRGERTTAAMP